MKVVLLGDVAKVIKGISYRSADYSEKGEGLAFINLKCVGRGGGFRREGVKYFSGKFKPDQSVTPGDILIANTDLTQDREIIGSPIFMPDLGEEACFSLDLSKLEITNPSLIDKSYLFYYLKAPQAREYMTSRSNGSTVMHLSVSSIPKMQLTIPDLDIQQGLAGFLNAIDEKIELNRRTNETLEKIGQAFFKYYFIDNSKAQTWPKRSLGEFFPVKTGKKDANFGTSAGRYPFFTCSQKILRAPDFSFDGHALLLAGNGDFNLKLYRGKFEAYQRTYVLIPHNENLLGFIYFLMSRFLKDIVSGSRGSVIKFITKGMIENFKFTAPTNRELLKISQPLNQLTLNIESNKREIQFLEELRDTLLPRLISGKIKV